MSVNIYNMPLLVGLLAIIMAASFAHAGKNSFYDFFPYGAYVHAHDPEGIRSSLDRELSDKELADCIERTCKDLAEHNMNCVWASGLAPWISGHAPLEKFLPMWLESGKRHGIRVIAQGGSAPSLLKPDYIRRPSVVNSKAEFADISEPYYREMAEMYRDDETLLAWAVTEEIEPIEWFYEAVADLTAKMAQWDPNHPMIMIDNKASSAWLNANIVKPKVLCRDVYPFFADGLNGPYQPTGFRSFLTRECCRFREAAETAGGVFWIMGQCMSLADTMFVGQNFTYRYPTPAEIRWQIWTAIQQGAKGEFFYTYRFLPPDDMFIHEGMRDHNGNETEQFRMTSEVGSQIKFLMPLLLRLEVAKPHETAVYWDNGPVSSETHIDRKTGRRFIIAVNNDCENIQPINIELGIWPHYVQANDKTFDLRTRRVYDYQTLKVTTLLPGDGTVLFVGTDEEWQRFSGEFFKKN